MMLRLWRDYCSAYGVTIVPLASSLLRCASYCSYAAPLPYIITFCSNIFPSYFCASLSPVAFSSIASLPSLRLTSLRFTSLHLATPRHLSLVISSHFYYSSLPSSSIPRYRSSPPPSLTLLTSHSFITSHLYYSSLPSSSIPRYRSSPLPLAHISSPSLPPSLPPTPSLITPPHRSPSLITLITFGAWHLVDLLVCPPRSTHAPPRRHPHHPTTPKPTKSIPPI